MKRKFCSVLAFLASLPVGANPAPAQTPSAPLLLQRSSRRLSQPQGRWWYCTCGHWCGPCLKEFLDREAGARSQQPGVDFLPVSLDDPTNRNAALVGRVLAARPRLAVEPHLEGRPPEDFVADLDPSWEGEIPAFFSYDARATCALLRRQHQPRRLRAIDQRPLAARAIASRIPDRAEGLLLHDIHVQNDEQPSPEMVLPSSQVSPSSLSTTPLPQEDGRCS